MCRLPRGLVTKHSQGQPSDIEGPVYTYTPHVSHASVGQTRYVYIFTQRVPKKVEFHVLTVVTCSLMYITLTLVPSCPTSQPLTSYSYLPASSPNKKPTPRPCRVCLGGVQLETSLHPNVSVQGGGRFAILKLRKMSGMEV